MTILILQSFSFCHCPQIKGMKTMRRNGEFREFILKDGTIVFTGLETLLNQSFHNVFSSFHHRRSFTRDNY